MSMRKLGSAAKASANITVGERPNPSGRELGLLHFAAGMLVERFFVEYDPCAAVGLSRQFRQISEHPALADSELRLLYRTLAARWHVLAIRTLANTQPRGSLLDEDDTVGRMV